MTKVDMSHATPELLAAYALAQGEIGNAEKSSKNLHFNSRYADLAEVLNTIRPAFSKHGLAIIQSTGFDGAMVYVTTIVTHSGGGWIASEAACVPAKSDAQGIGSATTYLRRYGASAISGISQEDDDGEAAAHSPAASAKASKPSKPIEEWMAAIGSAQTVTQATKIGREAWADYGSSPTARVDIRKAVASRKDYLDNAGEAPPADEAGLATDEG